LVRICFSLAAATDDRNEQACSYVALRKEAVVTLNTPQYGAMSSTQWAFDAMFRELNELGFVGIDTKPLDAHIERNSRILGDGDDKHRHSTF